MTGHSRACLYLMVVGLKYLITFYISFFRDLPKVWLKQLFPLICLWKLLAWETMIQMIVYQRR